MKAKLILSFILLLSLVVFCSCNKQNNNEALSVEGSDALDTSVIDTSDATEESSTEALTEATTEKDKQEIMKEIYDSMENKQLPIGGWSTPASALRDGYTGVEGSYDEMFKLIAASGVNYMITLEEWSSGSWPTESLSSAAKAGIKLYYNCIGTNSNFTASKSLQLFP